MYKKVCIFLFVSAPLLACRGIMWNNFSKCRFETLLQHKRKDSLGASCCTNRGFGKSLVSALCLQNTRPQTLFFAICQITINLFMNHLLTGTAGRQSHTKTSRRLEKRGGEATRTDGQQVAVRRRVGAKRGEEDR